MKLNINKNSRVVIDSHSGEWHSSPEVGLERLYLDREERPEITLATSLVRYAAGSSFPSHVHENGEEIFVLDGTFSDEHGTYPKGSYIHNPPGSAYAPLCQEDCLLFVKQQQLNSEDTERKVILTAREAWLPGMVEGLMVMPLHQFQTESIALVKWAPHTQFTPHRHWGGEEIFVLAGVFHDEHGVYAEGTWIRSPHLSAHTPFTRSEGCMILVKTGHL